MKGMPKKIEFTDDYGYECSLQESPIISGERCIWLGVDEPPIMEVGWHPEYPNKFRVASEERCANLYAAGRMHLTREQVAELLPHLQRFVDTGKIKRED